MNTPTQKLPFGGGSHHPDPDCFFLLLLAPNPQERAKLQLNLVRVLRMSLIPCRAMEVARKTEGIPEGDPLGPKYITLSYNYARLMELEGDFHGAEELFRDLTQRYEDYSDAHIRLG